MNKSTSNELDKGMGPTSSNVTTIGASEMTCKREPNNTKEKALMGVSKKSEETGACREKEDNSVTLTTSTNNSKERKKSEDTAETERAQLVTAHTKGELQSHKHLIQYLLYFLIICRSVIFVIFLIKFRNLI